VFLLLNLHVHVEMSV